MASPYAQAPLAGPASAPYRHTPALTRQPQAGASFYHYQPPHQPGYDPVHHAQPALDATDTIIQTLSQILLSQNAQSEARMNRLENALQRLISETTNSRQESRECVSQIAEVLSKSHSIQIARLQRLENILGMGAEVKEEKTLLNRFDLLSFAVEDLLERVKDPEANLPDGPLHHDMATSPLKHVYVDAVISPRTPSPSPLPQVSSVAVGSSPVDVFSDNHTLVADDFIPQIHKDPMDSPVENDTKGGFFNDILSRNTHKSTFAAAPPVTGSLVPVNWQDQSPSPERSFTFNPDRSPEGMQAYSALPNQPVAEGTIASLRQTSLGDRFAAPSTSTPCRSMSIHPVSSAPSLSPPQSPRYPTPFPTGAHDPSHCPPDVDDSWSPVLSDRSTTPPHTPILARQSSVGAVLPHSGSVSRAATVDLDSSVHPESPSAETVREELSVLDMMHSETHSNIASPPPHMSFANFTDAAVPSSESPSPMGGQSQRSSPPPRLTLSISPLTTTPTPPAASLHSETPFPLRSPKADTYHAPSPSHLFDAFMSPLSEALESPSTPSEYQSPTPALPKTEGVDSQPIPDPSNSEVHNSVFVLRPAGAEGYVTTRVKKRKAKLEHVEIDMVPEPPLKRARPSSEHKDGLPKQEKGKKRKKAEVVWPAMTPQEAAVPEFIGKFIGCDKNKCERWFHYTCLGIVPGDSRLDGTFHCPPCIAGHAPPSKLVQSGTEEQCSRPGCPVVEKFFESEGIFGRYTKLDAMYGRVTFWLVFWKGYKWSDATWEPEAPSEDQVKDFEQRAVAEGLDLDDDGCILLADAKEGGIKIP